MGLPQLQLLISEKCSEAIKCSETIFHLTPYKGKTLAIDTTSGLFPYLQAISEQGPNYLSTYLRINTHLAGAFIMTVRLMENGIKPLYVFSGNPSPLKKEETLRNWKRQGDKTRGKKKKEDPFDVPEEDSTKETVVDTSDPDVMNKFYRRVLMVGKRNEMECKALFKLMGVPFIIAPGEAAAQCAEIVRGGKAYATVSNDMSPLTFGSKILMTNLNFPPYPDLPLEEIFLEKVLTGLAISHTEFIDLSIMLGCEYCEGIRGTGRRNVYRLLVNNGSIERLLQTVGTGQQWSVAENWKYKEVKELFSNPVVTECKDLKWKFNKPDDEGVVDFLVNKHGLFENTIRRILRKDWRIK